ncbi:MAG TPA: M3 family metallopeptidase [Candidatus Dormibacteraeota bacterium]|nr:M3 family metallopeptidase [Candidatus Dormibacteraeota bacterium]
MSEVPTEPQFSPFDRPPTPDGLTDFAGVTPEALERVADAAITAAEAELAALSAEGAPLTFEARVQPLDDALATIYEASGRAAFMARVHPEAAVRDAGQAAEERLEKWQADLPYRGMIYRALDAYATSPAGQALDGQPRRLLDLVLRDFRRAGHQLPPETQAEVRALQARLVEIATAFQRNVDEWQDGVDLTRDELDGLPDAYVEALRPGETSGTYRVTLDYPEYFPFMEQGRRRDLRRRLEFKFETRALESNRALLDEALSIRRRMAHLLGYSSWADYRMEVRMAGSPGRVWSFMGEVVPGLQALARDEHTRMQELLAADEGEGAAPPELRTWDTRYYHQRRLEAEHGVDAVAVSEYFPVDGVLRGLFELCEGVFGLRITEQPASHAWHPDVRLFELRDAASGARLAWFYADLFPRPGKYGHAMAVPMRVGRWRGDAPLELPISAIVANVAKPGADGVALMRHSDVTMLFHEFGHILHESLGRPAFARLSLYGVEDDFVEAPSQIMEHWTWDADTLRRFARHYQTGEPIPTGLVDGLVAARNLDIGARMLYSFGRFTVADLRFHEAEPVDPEAVATEAEAVRLLPRHEGSFWPSGFDHIFGGYDAGYYGYLWSQVYGDDLWSRFAAEGVTDPVVGMAYRRAVLEAVATQDAVDEMRAFLGREPSSDAFFARIGLTPAGAGAG